MVTNRSTARPRRGQHHRNDYALRLAVGQAKLALMEPDDLLRDGQPQAESAYLGREERLQAVVLPGSQARPVVLDAHTHPIAVGGRPNRDPAARPRGLACVAD